MAAASPEHITLVCAGTGEEAAWEDTLAAGAMAEALHSLLPNRRLSDATLIAMAAWKAHRATLGESLALGANGARLNDIPDLRDDIAFCSGRDQIDRVARQAPSGEISLL